MKEKNKRSTVRTASDTGVYEEIQALIDEMREQGVMPSSEEDVYAHLNLYEDSPIDDPRYYVGITIKRFF